MNADENTPTREASHGESVAEPRAVGTSDTIAERGTAATGNGTAAASAPGGHEQAGASAGTTASAGEAPGTAGRPGADSERAAEAEVEGDLDELVKVAAQRDEYLALAQRTHADFENYRKRVAREAASAQERGACTLAKELLPALDNLDRALEAAAHDDPLLEGVRLVRAELSAALARQGIESFSPLGEEFDPTWHEALASVPHDGEGDPPASGVVLEVYQPGYRLGTSVIRPARVVVSA